MKKRWLIYTIKAMRPRQWLKNVLLLAGLFFAHKLLDPVSVQRALLGFVVFCLLSGSVYLFNDIIDVERDRLHPRKKKRPIASGALPISVAGVVTVVAGLGGMVGAFALSRYFGMCALAYMLLMIPYSFWLKDVFLVDTMCIAMGFIIRAVSGVIVLRTPANHVPLTSWFVICVMFLALFLAFSKRRSERVRLDLGAATFRPVLAMYSIALLDKAIGVCAAAAIMSYTLYATSVPNPWSMLTTLPFVLYGIMRYLHLVFTHEGGEAPELVLTTDLPLLGCVGLWCLSQLLVYSFSF